MPRLKLIVAFFYSWSIVDHTKERIDALRRVLPLIGDLKNPAMRERHWNRVKNAIKRDFDETASNFTLEYILELEMQNYTQDINEISIAATGELIIENGIKAIAEMWETLAIQWQLPKDSEIYRYTYSNPGIQKISISQSLLLSLMAFGLIKRYRVQKNIQ